MLVYIDPDDGNAYKIEDSLGTADGKSEYVTISDIFGSHERFVKRSDLQAWESREVDPLAPDQIRVAVILPNEIRNRMGHETFAVPLGGGRIEATMPLPNGSDGKLVIEVYPESSLEGHDGRTRSYDKLKTLADQIVKDGGYMITGDQMTVGKEIIGGRDQIELLRMIARNWGEQASDQKAAFRQGYDAGRRATAEAVKKAVETAQDEYDDE